MNILNANQLGRRLGTGVKVRFYDTDSKCHRIGTLVGVYADGIDIVLDGSEMWIPFENPVYKSVQLILRPLELLTQPIKQENYNNGEPFVPIEHLTSIKSCCNGYWEDYNAFDSKNPKNYDDLITWELQLSEWNKLLMWHFALDEPKGSYITTKELGFDPYN